MEVAPPEAFSGDNPISQNAPAPRAPPKAISGDESIQTIEKAFLKTNHPRCRKLWASCCKANIGNIEFSWTKAFILCADVARLFYLLPIMPAQYLMGANYNTCGTHTMQCNAMMKIVPRSSRHQEGLLIKTNKKPTKVSSVTEPLCCDLCCQQLLTFTVSGKPTPMLWDEWVPLVVT